MIRRRVRGSAGYAAALAAGLLGLVAPVRTLAQQTAQPPANAAQAQTETPLPLPQLLIPGNVQPDLVAPAAPANYIIGDNDLLSIFVYQMPEMTRQVRVSTVGMVRIPFAQKNFLAAGKTSRALQDDIAADLAAEGLVRSPIVQVTVVQVESKPIVVGGAVQRPVVVQAARPMRLLEVLSNAGGLTANAGNQVLVTTLRHAGADPSPTPGSSHSYDLNQLIREQNPADNPLLTGSEMVTVLPARYIYVVGEFNHPGAFPLVMGEPISVVKAVSLAQGFSANPDRANAEIIRTLANGEHSEIPINIAKILKFQVPDPPMQAGDILYVGRDTKRTVLLAGLADAAQLLTLGAAYHFP